MVACQHLSSYITHIFTLCCYQLCSRHGNSFQGISELERTSICGGGEGVGVHVQIKKDDYKTTHTPEVAISSSCFMLYSVYSLFSRLFDTFSLWHFKFILDTIVNILPVISRENLFYTTLFLEVSGWLPSSLLVAVS